MKALQLLKQNIDKPKDEKRKNYPVKFDKKNEIGRYLLQGLSIPEIAQELELTETEVKKIINAEFPFFLDFINFSENKVQCFEIVQQMALGFLVKKLPTATIKDLTMIIDVLQENIQLLKGKSNKNIAVSYSIEEVIKQVSTSEKHALDYEENEILDLDTIQIEE